MSRTTCAFIRPDGNRCKAHPLTGDHYCINHSTQPRAVAIRAAASRKGGKMRTRPDAITSWSTRPINSLEDVRSALSEVLNAGMNGELPTARLTALATVANAIIKAIAPEAPEEPEDITDTVLEVLRDYPDAHEALIQRLRGIDESIVAGGSGDDQGGMKGMRLKAV